MLSIIAKACGVAGLLFIIAGVIAKRKRKENELYIIGGTLLFIYSSYLHDLIFMTLQAVFVAVAFYELLKRGSRNKKRRR